MHCLDQKICPYFTDKETEAWDDVVTCTNMGRSGIQFCYSVLLLNINSHSLKQIMHTGMYMCA